MAGKQLSIIVSAVDQATGPLRNIAAQTVNIGSVSIATADKVDRAAKKSSGSIFSVANAVKALVAGLAVNRLRTEFNETAKTMEDIGLASAKFQMPVEEMSRWRYQAKLADVDFQSMISGMTTAWKNISIFVNSGGGKAAEQLRRLNVPLRDANGNVRSMSELLPDLLDAIARKDPAERIEYLTKVFGQSGDLFVRFLNEGTTKLRMYGEQAERLGVVFTPEMIATAQRYNDSLDHISEAWLGLKSKVIATVGDDLAAINDELAGFIAALPELLGNVRTVIQASLTGTLDDAQRARLTGVMDSVQNVLVTSVKGLGKVLAASMLDLMSFLVGFVAPLMKATLVQVWVKPLHEAGVDVLKEMNSIVSTAANLHRTITLGVKLAETAKAGEELHALETRLKAAEGHATQMRTMLSGTTKFSIAHNVIGQEIRTQELAMEELREKIVMVRAEAMKPIKLTGLEAARQQALDTAAGMTQALTNVAVATQASVQESLDSLSFSMIDEAVEEAFKGDSAALAAAKKALEDLRPALVAAAGEIDGLLGISAAMEKTRISTLEAKYAMESYGEVLGEIPEKMNAISFADLRQGAVDALDEIREKANDVVGFAKDAVLGLSQTISSGLAGAMVDVVSGAKSLKAAFSEFLSSTLRQVSQLIMQFLILRAISGIAGAFSGPSAGQVAGVSGASNAARASAAGMGGGIFGPGISAGYQSMLTRNMGGPIVRIPMTDFHRFNMGSLVPGPRNHRDSVPVLATPGERMVNERGSRATSPEAWAYSNNGGRLVPDYAARGGGGITLTVNTTVNVMGGGERGRKDADSIGQSTARQVAEAVIAVMQTNPSKARQMGAAIGVRS